MLGERRRAFWIWFLVLGLLLLLQSYCAIAQKKGQYVVKENTERLGGKAILLQAPEHSIEKVQPAEICKLCRIKVETFYTRLPFW